LLDTFLYTKV